MSSALPNQRVSLATVKYLGFNDETATRLWNKWVAKADKVNSLVQTSFLDHIMEPLSRLIDLDTDKDDAQWFEWMDLFGINQDTQAAIMDPVFKRIRQTQSCHFWVCSTMRLRYRAVMKHQRFLKSEQAVQRAVSYPERPSTQDTEIRDLEQAIQRAALHSGDDISSDTEMSEAPTNAASNELCFISQDMAMSTATNNTASDAADFVTLYRGIAMYSIDTYLRDEEFWLDGIYGMSGLGSRPPTDFCRQSKGYSFTADRDIAEYDACYIKRRSPASTATILQLTIPSLMIESLSDRVQHVYWPSEEWKKLVFLSRTVILRLDDLPDFGNAALVIGTIASKLNRLYRQSYHRLEITEEIVLKTKDGRNAIQYVFFGAAGEAVLKRAVRDIFPVTTAKYDKWYREESKGL